MLKTLIKRYPILKDSEADIKAAAEKIIACYEKGGKLLLCGNGGSAADCDHIVGELMKGFLKMRPLSDQQKAQMKAACPLLEDETLGKLQGALPAISLPNISGLNSAFCNDVDPELIYAQSLISLGNKEDILLALSTSGNSKNVLAAAKVAKGLGLTVIGLTGKTGGKLKDVCDLCICANETETFKIQELHLPIYHYLCAETEAHFFEK
ncbi:MAG: SIS domain-containing protein [Ruminococcaceae bacterium]|nr:SIS domain-containing protein [Oscillospiraceae bacterium]